MRLQEQMQSLDKYVSENQQSLRELTEIYNEILRRRPCSVLVYGVGNDSSMYIEANVGGSVRFYEHCQTWIDKMPPEIKARTEHRIYPTTLDWSKTHMTDFTVGDSYWKSNNLVSKKFDVIVIDGPTGYSSKCPGRHIPIIEAAKYASQQDSIAIFVHDCNRELENKLCENFLKNKHGLKFEGYDRTYKFYK